MKGPPSTRAPRHVEVIVVGGGLAGLSAAIYLGRARRHTLVIDSGKSMARWEPSVRNYLGFPKGISGDELLKRARHQARRSGVAILSDDILSARRLRRGMFRLRGRKAVYTCERLLLATGIFHIPPAIPGIVPCLGHSLFFCKDCDGERVDGKAVAIYGWTNETVRYALAMLSYSPRVAIVVDGRKPKWNRAHARWIREHRIPVCLPEVAGVHRRGRRLRELRFKDGSCLRIDALFTTRGDIYFNRLARALGARINEDGEVVVDVDMRTTVPGLFAAGCLTPANCQMIIAAGQGAAAAQTINRELLDESLARHSLRRFRAKQVRSGRTRPAIRRARFGGERPILMRAGLRGTYRTRRR